MNLFISLPEDLQRFILLFLSNGEYKKISSSVLDNPYDVFWKLKLSTMEPKLSVINYKTLCEKKYYKKFLRPVLDDERIQILLNDDNFLQNYVHLESGGGGCFLTRLYCSGYNKEYVKTILSKGNIELLKPSFHFILDNSIFRGDDDIFRMLLACGADVNEDCQEITHLNRAIMCNNFYGITLLVENGADITKKSKPKELNAIQCARERGYNHIVEYLEKMLST
jgi:hypothetical protein